MWLNNLWFFQYAQRCFNLLCGAAKLGLGKNGLRETFRTGHVKLRPRVRSIPSIYTYNITISYHHIIHIIIIIKYHHNQIIAVLSLQLFNYHLACAFGHICHMVCNSYFGKKGSNDSFMIWLSLKKPCSQSLFCNPILPRCHRAVWGFSPISESQNLTTFQRSSRSAVKEKNTLQRWIFPKIIREKKTDTKFRIAG